MTISAFFFLSLFFRFAFLHEQFYLIVAHNHKRSRADFSLCTFLDPIAPQHWFTRIRSYKTTIIIVAFDLTTLSSSCFFRSICLCSYYQCVCVCVFLYSPLIYFILHPLLFFQPVFFSSLFDTGSLRTLYHCASGLAFRGKNHFFQCTGTRTSIRKPAI